MKPDNQSYIKLLSCGFDCERPIGGNCVGNCRVIDNSDTSLVWQGSEEKA